MAKQLPDTRRPRPVANPNDLIYGVPSQESNKESKTDEKDSKSKKITFSSKLEPATFLRLQQLATYGGEKIQEILEGALKMYCDAHAEDADRPLTERALAALKSKYPTL